MSDNPRPPRSPESSDWRFAVLVLLTLLLASLALGVIVYVHDGTVPNGLSNLGSAITGALVVIIGKRMI